jgi:hypothetical protein
MKIISASSPNVYAIPPGLGKSVAFALEFEITTDECFQNPASKPIVNFIVMDNEHEHYFTTVKIGEFFLKVGIKLDPSKLGRNPLVSLHQSNITNLDNGTSVVRFKTEIHLDTILSRQRLEEQAPELHMHIWHAQTNGDDHEICALLKRA